MSDPFNNVNLLRIIQEGETDADSPVSEELMSQIRENWEVLMMLAFYTGDSGTATTDPSETVLTDTGASYDTDEHNGRTLVIIDGNAAGNYYTIDDTAANTLTCTGDTIYTDGVRSGDAYKVFYNLQNTSAHTHDDTDSPAVTLPDGKIMLPYYMSEEATEQGPVGGAYSDYTYSFRAYIPTNAANVRLAARTKGSGSGNIGVKLTIGSASDETDPLAVTAAYAWDTSVLVDVSAISGWQDAVVAIKYTSVSAYLQGFSLSWEN